MAEESSALRKYLKKEDIYDKDVEAILSSCKVADPENDLKTMTQEQWDEIYRLAVVERAKELKDQQTKVRLERKMAKLEKLWRDLSGVKKTSIKPDSKAASDEKGAEDTVATAASQELLSKAGELKAFLQKEGCFNLDLLAVLSDHGVNKEADIPNIQTNMEWGTITREFRVKQRGKNKEQSAKTRADKVLTKFEKIWRAKTGIKSTSIKDKGDAKEQKEAPKNSKIKELETEGKALKSWMKKNGIWQLALYEELMKSGVTDETKCKKLNEKEFDEIVRKVRVERFKDLKDTKARQAADKLLVKFEKFWRKESGIKKTSIQKGK